MMDLPYDVTANDRRHAEYEAAREIIQEFWDSELLTQALIRCAPMLIASWASEQASPTASLGEAMHGLRREAFELLRLMDAATPPETLSPTIPGFDLGH